MNKFKYAIILIILFVIPSCTTMNSYNDSDAESFEMNQQITNGKKRADSATKVNKIPGGVKNQSISNRIKKVKG